MGVSLSSWNSVSWHVKFMAFSLSNFVLHLLNGHSRLIIHCEFFYSSLTRLFPHLCLFLTQFLSILFFREYATENRKIREDQKDSSRDEEQS